MQEWNMTMGGESRLPNGTSLFIACVILKVTFISYELLCSSVTSHWTFKRNSHYFFLFSLGIGTYKRRGPSQRFKLIRFVTFMRIWEPQKVHKNNICYVTYVQVTKPSSGCRNYESCLSRGKEEVGWHYYKSDKISSICCSGGSRTTTTTTYFVLYTCCFSLNLNNLIKNNLTSK